MTTNLLGEGDFGCQPLSRSLHPSLHAHPDGISWLAHHFYHSSSLSAKFALQGTCAQTKASWQKSNQCRALNFYFYSSTKDLLHKVKTTSLGLHSPVWCFHFSHLKRKKNICITNCNFSVWKKEKRFILNPLVGHSKDDSFRLFSPNSLPIKQ